MGVPFHQSLSTEIDTLAAAYGIPTENVDGMDVAAVYESTVRAVEHARSGEGPYFIEALTYRYRGHSMADPELYRLKEEIEQARKRDAIQKLKDEMIEHGWLDQDEYQSIVDRVERDVDGCVEFAEQSPEPTLDSLYDNIFRENGRG
jgi:pyruvate dehydrogenase E1 component alpha subunit